MSIKQILARGFLTLICVGVLVACLELLGWMVLILVGAFALMVGLVWSVENV